MARELQITYNSKVMQYNKVVLGLIIFTVAQTLSWYQSNGQFMNTWFKENPFLVALLMGVPIGLGYIYGTTYLVEAFDGELWPARLLGFATGILSFSALTYLHMKEGINIKTAVILVLATIILLLQVFWKIDE